MNKIHSKVWNRALNQLVVASEMAACHRGGRQGQGGRRPSLRSLSPFFIVLMASGWLGWASSAQAQSLDCTVAPYNIYSGSAMCAGYQSQATQGGTTAIGFRATSSGVNATTLGYQALASGINSMYLGARTTGTGASGESSIAIGTDVNSSGSGAIGIGVQSRAGGLSGVALGVQANAAVAYATALGGGGVNPSTSVRATGVGSLAIGGNATSGALASGADAIAIGGQSVSSTQYSVALGLDAAATGPGGAMALGASTVSNNINTVALGVNASATGAGASALGTAASASGGNATAVGVGSTASGNYAFAGGYGSQATALRSITIGTNAASTYLDAIAQGTSANAGGQNAIAIGFQSIASEINSINLGARTAAGTGATAEGAIAIGTDVTASLDRAIAMGVASKATDTDALAVGTRAGATASYATALGAGGTTVATAVRAAGIGSVAIGGNATLGASASGANAIAMGGEAVADADEAVAIGRGSTATGGKAVAVGSGNIANGDGAVAIGDPNTATGNGAIASGLDNTATGNGSVAMGNSNMVGGGGQAVSTPGTAAQGAVGIGYQNTVVGQGSVALGSTSSALAAGALAFGDTAVANNAGDVALGSGSTTDTAVGTASYAIGGVTYNFAGTAPARTVSIGAAGTERTLTNLAAGRISGSSTDAINGSQLFATNQAVEALASNVDANAVHYFSVNDNSVAGANYTNDGATGLNATAAGMAAAASGDYATALGFNSGASGVNATAIGNGSTATGSGAAAVGFHNFANGANSLAAGSTNKTYVASATATAAAVGYDNAISGDGSAGFGDSNRVGNYAVDANNNYTRDGNGYLQPGGGTNVLRSYALGGDNIIGAVNLNTTGASAVGAHNWVAGDNATALGSGNAVGTWTPGTDGVSATIVASASHSTAVGDSNSTQSGYASVFGYANSVNAGSRYSTTIGAQNALSSGSTNATAIGSNNAISAAQAVAIGYQNTASAQDAFAAGSGNVASGAGSIAFGVGNTVSGDNSGAFGDPSTVTGTGSYSFGNNNSIASDNAFVMGSGVTIAAGLNGAVALGNGTVVAASNPTASTTINGNTYNFAGAAPAVGGVVSVGAAGLERQITNVAAGRIDGSSTDAINGSQLFATNTAIEDLATAVDAGATHYYSVNDGGTPGGNYANDGASGLNALAAGVGASATADSGTALGQNTGVSVLGGVALGSGALSDRAIAPTSGSILVGTNVIPYNTTDRNLLGAVSVGNATDFRQITNVADGTLDQDAVTLRQLKGAMSSFSVTPIEYFHANSTATDSAAIGAESVAIGPQTTVNGDNGIGLGNGAIVQQTAPGGTAIGQNATVNLADGVALGTNATSNGIQAMALGAGTQAAFAGSVALGAGSVTDAAVGTASTTLNGTTYSFAGTTPGSTVSVGAAGAERTITNVAAGRISDTSTDAINGSQLFATNQAIGTVGTSVTNLGNTMTALGDSIANSYGGSTTYDPVTGTLNTNISYGGNTYSSLQQIFNQIDTGGIKYFHANSNLADSLANGLNSVAIGPVSTANTENAVSIGNGATAGSNVGDVALGAGSTTGAVVQTGGDTIDGNTYTYAGATPTSTVSVGTAGAERTITNVAAGQVNGGSTDAVNGSQLFATNQAVENLSSTVTANAIHYYSVNDGGTPGSNYANDGASGLNALAAGVGASATADNGTALGQGTGVSVLGGVALGSGAVSDRAIAPTSGSILVGTNVIPYNTTDRNLLGAVSVGNATDFRQITNLADGTLDQDAVTLRQLKGAMSSFSVTPIKYFHANSTASDSLAAGAESVAIGPQTTVNGDNGIGLGNGAIVQQTAPGGTAIGQNATVNLADGVALGTNATSNGIQAMALGAGAQAAYAGSVALGAGSATDAAVATAGTTINGNAYAFAGATPGSTVSVGSVGAERTLTNMAAGRISGTSTDAINGSQLYATNQALEGLYSQFNILSTTVNNLPSGGGTTVNNTFQTSTDNTAQASSSGDNSTAAGAGSTASGNNSTAVGSGSTASGDNSVAIGAGSVASQANTVSVGSAGQERTVTNVAEGVNSTDAVNVGQLSDAIAQAKDWSKNYTDQRFQSVDRDLNRIGNRANAGIASAMAMASLPQAYQPNQSSAGVALGSFHGEASVALGLSTISESGRYVFKLNATTNSRGDAGAGVGAGIVW